MLTFGLVINPYAGIGGAVGLKGSDHMVEEAFLRGAEQKAMARAQQALAALASEQQPFKFITCPGDMGQSVLEALNYPHRVLAMSVHSPTCAEDTRQAVKLLVQQDIDVLVFAGGDGTARDILQALDEAGKSQVAVLGIPAGVKIHSAVYGVTPQASGSVLQTLVRGGLVDIKESEVRDLDEDAFRQDKVIARQYGEMRVPQVGHFVQAVKQGGVESEELVLADIAAEIRDLMDEHDDTLFLIGSGKTTQAIMQDLGLDNTLLGVDAVFAGQLLANDVDEQQLLQLFDQYPKRLAVVSVMGGQGHIFGRGNQQFSARVLWRLGKEQVCLVSTKTKLMALDGRPLRMDSGDVELDQQWSGTIEVITGYRDRVVQNLS